MNSEKKVRTFKVKLHNEDSTKFRGRFTGKTPQQAGKKALTSLLKEAGKKTGKIDYVLKECSRGCCKKEYGYSGHKFKRKTPNEVSFKNVDNLIKYNYDSKILSNKKLLNM